MIDKEQALSRRIGMLHVLLMLVTLSTYTAGFIPLPAPRELRYTFDRKTQCEQLYMSQRSRTRQRQLLEQQQQRIRENGAVGPGKKGFGTSSPYDTINEGRTQQSKENLSNTRIRNKEQYTKDVQNQQQLVETHHPQPQQHPHWSTPSHYKVELPLNNGNDLDTTHDTEPQVQHNVFETWITRARQDISHVATQGFSTGPSTKLVSASPEWKRLERHAKHIVERTHLRDMLKDQERCDALVAEFDGVYYDYSRQQVNLETMKLLKDLATRQRLEDRIEEMMSGEKINFTEDRAVLHTALRADRSEIGTIMVDGVDAVGAVYQELDQIKMFSEKIRSGELRGYTGKRLRNFVSVGIGGSYLGPEFLHECLRTDSEGASSSLGYTLRFLANIDPIDFERATVDLDPEETMILIVSKTFTTAETMLNAKTMRQWLWDYMGNDPDVVKKHFVACASISSAKKVEEFGIDTDNYFFHFWDWVGGRYSVCSAVGAVPISLQYGYDIFEEFLDGARSIDEHFRTAPFEKNVPILMGMVGVWNMSFLGYKGRALLPYAEALLKLPAHVQQLDMESNGKSVTKDNLVVDYNVGEVNFGEPGTNGQHSFYQLMHMGQTVPSDFIGFIRSQHDLYVDGQALSSHDELMANFFAQPDALANGKTPEEVKAEGVPAHLIPHKTFTGNRPSSSLLLPQLTPYVCGQILALFEHRTAVQGFIWDVNSFDQWGVELGKKLALDVKTNLMEARKDPNQDVDTGSPATTRILNYYAKRSYQPKTDKTPVSEVTSVKRRSQDT